MDLPKTDQDLLNDHHEGSVAKFLADKPEIYNLGRYREFVEGLEHVTRATARQIGHEMVICIGRADDPSKVGDAIKLARAFVKGRGSYPDSSRSYKLGIQSGMRVSKRQSSEQQSIAQLLARIAELEAEVRKLKIENRNLRNNPPKRPPENQPLA